MALYSLSSAPLFDQGPYRVPFGTSASWCSRYDVMVVTMQQWISLRDCLLHTRLEIPSTLTSSWCQYLPLIRCRCTHQLVSLDRQFGKRVCLSWLSLSYCQHWHSNVLLIDTLGYCITPQLVLLCCIGNWAWRMCMFLLIQLEVFALNECVQLTPYCQPP